MCEEKMHNPLPILCIVYLLCYNGGYEVIRNILCCFGIKLDVVFNALLHVVLVVMVMCIEIGIFACVLWVIFIECLCYLYIVNECCYLPFIRRVGGRNFKFVMVLSGYK